MNRLGRRYLQRLASQLIAPRTSSRISRLHSFVRSIPNSTNIADEFEPTEMATLFPRPASPPRTWFGARMMGRERPATPDGGHHRRRGASRQVPDPGEGFRACVLAVGRTSRTAHACAGRFGAQRALPRPACSPGTRLARKIPSTGVSGSRRESVHCMARKCAPDANVLNSSAAVGQASSGSAQQDALRRRCSDQRRGVPVFEYCRGL